MKTVLIIFSLMAMALSMSLSATVFAQPAPQFVLNSASGTINLANYKGKVVYLDFWASWCAPCRKSFPWMNTMQEKYHDLGFKIIAINLDEDKNKAEQFLKETPANFTIAYDPTSKVARTYKVKGMPSSYLIDRKGNILSEHQGFFSSSKESLEQTIRKALAQ